MAITMATTREHARAGTGTGICVSNPTPSTPVSQGSIRQDECSEMLHRRFGKEGLEERTQGARMCMGVFLARFLVGETHHIVCLAVGCLDPLGRGDRPSNLPRPRTSSISPDLYDNSICHCAWGTPLSRLPAYHTTTCCCSHHPSDFFEHDGDNSITISFLEYQAQMGRIRRIPRVDAAPRKYHRPRDNHIL